MSFAKKGALAAICVAALTFAGCSNYDKKLIASAIKMKENLGGVEHSEGRYFHGNPDCIFMFKRERGSWDSFYKIADIEIGEKEMNARKSNYPYLGGMELYDLDELRKVCLEIDSNPINGNRDRLAVPEETEATLRLKLDGKY